MNEMNSIAVILRRGVSVELRVETPSARRLAQKQTGRVVAIKIMLLQGIVVHVAKVDVARHVQWKAWACSRLGRGRLLPLFAGGLRGSLGPPKRACGYRQAEDLKRKVLHLRARLLSHSWHRRARVRWRAAKRVSTDLIGGNGGILYG